MSNRGRPKGSKQSRNEAKYWLPVGVTLKDDGSLVNYNKETLLLFEDAILGEFESSFKAIQSANASTHPIAIKNRRESTNLKKYGNINAGATAISRNKAQATMLEKYGVSNALQNPEILNKSRETLKNNHGVDHPSKSEKIRNKTKATNLSRYGVDNPGKLKEFNDKAIQTSIRLYGVDNPAKSAKVKELILQAQINNAVTGGSKGEQELKSYIEELGFTTKKGYIGGSDPKEIDIFVNELPIAFEYNGAYYHSEVIPQIHNRYHLNKTLALEEKGIKLIHIFDFEWENRNRAVKSFIKSSLGKNSRIVYGRKCQIVGLTLDQTRDFLNDYHILGGNNMPAGLGLVCDGELVALASFGKHHRKNNNELVLRRFCGKENVTVIGGLSKLSNAMKEFGPITTWIDRRISDGKNWIKAGWEPVHALPPDYFYIDSKNGKIISKQSRKKSVVGTPADMTEHEHALSEKLYRIYDCGKIKLVLK